LPPRGKYSMPEIKGERKCARCGNKFTPKVGSQNYCRESCRFDARNTKVVSYYKKCVYCKEWFYAKSAAHAFCSESCVNGKRTFSRKNISPSFDREYFLEKYDFTCQICSSRLPWGELHCHHVLPLCFGGEDIETNLTVLCVKCHQEIHTPQGKERIKNAIPT
jgi:hypothetical protein